MTLHPITANGIQVWCSDLVVAGEDDMAVLFLSVCGYQATVKGIVANLVEGQGLCAKICNRDHYIDRAELAYRVLLKKLPSGLAQAMILPKLALARHDEEEKNRFFILTRDQSQMLTLFFRHLDDKTDLPLHPDWSGWLWKTFQAEGWLQELQTLAGDFTGHQVLFYQDRLEELISQAIQDREPEITACFKNKEQADEA